MFGIILLAGFLIRLWFSTFGHNHDLISWEIVGRIVSEGKNVFLETHRWPYAPVMTYFFGGIYKLNEWVQFPHKESFHLWIVIFLSFCDASIAVILWRKFSKLSAVFFYLSPVAFLITGFHSQIDNVSILFAMVSWMLLCQDPSSDKKFAASVILMGISLGIKHVFFFFPLWIFFYPKVDCSKKFLYLGGVYAIFALTFLPFWIDEESRNNVLRYVFKYEHRTGNALSVAVLELFFPAKYWVNNLRAGGLLKFVMLAGTLVTGYRVMRRQPELAIFYYVLAIVVFSSQMADQYLVIPLIACAFYYRSPFSWLYIVFSTGVILMSYDNIRLIQQINPDSPWYKLNHVKWGGVWQYYHAQIWLLFLWLGIVFFDHSKKQEEE